MFSPDLDERWWVAKLCSVKQYVLLWYHGIIFHELNNTSMTIWVIWPLILRFEFSRHVYHLCFVYVASKLEADVSIHFSLQPEYISLLMVAINSLPPQDSTWIKVTIKEKCRVFFYDQTSSDLIHLKRLKRMNTKTAPPPHTHTRNLYKSVQHLHFIFESALQKMAFWGRKGRSFKKRLLG